MTKYDLRQWKKKDEMTASQNIAEAKFATWRTRILFAAANADAEDAKLAPKQLLIEMITDTVQLWDSGLKGSLRDCANLYDQVWCRMCWLFKSLARIEILELNGYMTAFKTVAEDLATQMIEDSGKHTYVSIADESTSDSGKERTDD